MILCLHYSSFFLVESFICRRWCFLTLLSIFTIGMASRLSFSLYIYYKIDKIFCSGLRFSAKTFCFLWINAYTFFHFRSFSGNQTAVFLIHTVLLQACFYTCICQTVAFVYVHIVLLLSPFLRTKSVQNCATWLNFNPVMVLIPVLLTLGENSLYCICTTFILYIFCIAFPIIYICIYIYAFW